MKIFFIFIILTCSIPSVFADIRADIEAAKKDVAKAKELVEQRRSELEAARKALIPFNEKIYRLEKEKNELLENLYIVNPALEGSLRKQEQFINRLKSDISELKGAEAVRTDDGRQANINALEKQLITEEQKRGLIKQDIERDFTAKREQYEQAVEKYFAAAKEAQPAEIAVMTAVSFYQSAEERLYKIRQKLAQLREQAVKGLGKEAPPYLMRVVAETSAGAFYSATWVAEEEELDKKIKLIKEEMEIFKERISRLNEDVKAAMAGFENANRALQSATHKVVGALWNTFWYDVFADASVLAIKIMLDYREMGPWAFPYQAIEQTVAAFSDDAPSGPDLSVLYGQRSPAEDSVVFSQQFVNNRGGDVIQKFVSEGIEAMLGGHAVMIVDGDLHAALETHILNWDKAGTPETGFYNKIKNKLFPEEIKAHVTTIPKLKDIRFKDIQDAAGRKVTDPDWWRSRVGADLLKDAALEAARGMLPSTTWYFEREPAVGEYVAAQGACEISYRWLKLFQNRRNIAARGLEALQKELDETLDELEKKRHKRKLEKAVNEEAEGDAMTLMLIFSSEMDNVEVKIGDYPVDGGIEGKVWIGKYDIGGEERGELVVSGIEKTSRKELDSDPSTITRLVTEGARNEFEDWEKGPDRSHTLLFKPPVLFVKRVEFEMSGKVYYDAEWELKQGAVERSLSRRIDNAINRNNIRDGKIKIWFSKEVEGVDFTFGGHEVILDPKYPSEFFSGKIKSDIIKDEAALPEINLLIRPITEGDIPFDRDPKTIAQTDAKAPGGWRGLESDKMFDTSHKINVGKKELPVTGKFLLDSVFTKADFEDILAEFYPVISDRGGIPQKRFYVAGGDTANRYKEIEELRRREPMTKKEIWESGQTKPVVIFETYEGPQTETEMEPHRGLMKYSQGRPGESRVVDRVPHVGWVGPPTSEVGFFDTSGMYSLTTMVESFGSNVHTAEGSVFCFGAGGKKGSIEIQMYFCALPSDMRARVNALAERKGDVTKAEGYPFFDDVYITAGAANLSTIPIGKTLCGLKDNLFLILYVEAPENLEDAIRRKVVDRLVGNIKNIVFFDQSEFPPPLSTFPIQAGYWIASTGIPWLVIYSTDPSSKWYLYSQKFELDALDVQGKLERLARNFHKLPPEKQKELIDEIRRMPPEEREKLPPELRRLAE